MVDAYIVHHPVINGGCSVMLAAINDGCILDACSMQPSMMDASGMHADINGGCIQDTCSHRWRMHPGCIQPSIGDASGMHAVINGGCMRHQSGCIRDACSHQWGMHPGSRSLSHSLFLSFFFIFSIFLHPKIISCIQAPLPCYRTLSEPAWHPSFWDTLYNFATWFGLFVCQL